MNSEQVLHKLQEGEAHQLVVLATNFLFRQPIQHLFPSSFLESQIQLLLQSIVAGEQTRVWVTKQIEELRDQVPEGYPNDFIPVEVVQPWKNLLLHEMELDQKLVHHLLDHKAVEALFHEVLYDALTEFTKTIKNWGDIAGSATPKGVSKGFGRLRAIGERALKESPLGSVTTMIEEQAQKKISEYLERSISEVIRMSSVHVAAEENRQLQATFRVHVLDVLLSTRNEKLLKQIEVIAIEDLVNALTETIQALLQRESFQDEVKTVVSSVLDSFGEQSLFAIMEEAGIEDHWRSETEEHLSSLVLGFLETEEAKGWLSRLLN